MTTATFGIIGSGWRSDFYLRIARQLENRFHVAGMVVRDANKAMHIEDTWRISTYRTIEDLLRIQKLDFIVLCVSRSAVSSLLFHLANYNIPILSETPPASTLSDLIALHQLTKRNAKIQIAEQYAFQPLHAARLAMVASGKLGTVTQAQVSAARVYHGMSLIRKYLSVMFEPVVITAHSFIAPVIEGPSRNGHPIEEKVVQSEQVIAYMDFGNKFGVYDFSIGQYFSWIRSHRVLIRGERGEVHDAQVRYLANFDTPITLNLLRQDAGMDGNLEGFYHKGILAGNEWIYRNPFWPARLTDEEIAIATCLNKMKDYSNGGPSFYSLAEASQDQYLSLLIEDSTVLQRSIRSMPQIWSQNL